MEFKRLTEHQMRIARHRCEGKTSDQIARLLFISPQTVKNHFTAIYQHLGLHHAGNRDSLMCYFMGASDSQRFQPPPPRQVLSRSLTRPEDI